MTTRPILDPASTTTTTTTTAAAAISTSPRPASPLNTAAASSSPSLSSRVAAFPPQTPLYSTSNPLFGRPATLASSSAVKPEAALHKAWQIIAEAQVTHDLNASYKHALMIACEALEQHPKNADLFALKATCHFNLAQYEAASEAACRALEHDADNGVAMSVLMDCDEARSNQSVLPILRTPAPRATLRPEAFRAALDSVLRLDQPDLLGEAMERLRLEANATLDRDAEDTKAFCTKIFCSIFQGKMLDMDLMAFLQNPTHIELTSELFAKTLPIVEAILSKNADHLPALILRMGCICFSAQRLTMKAIFEHVFSRPAEGRAKPEDTLVLLTGVVDIGQRQFYAEPLAAAQDLLKRDPKNRLGMIVNIEALRMLGRVDEAEKMVEEALALFPNDDFVWVLKSLCCLSKNDPQGAKAVQAALDLNPKTNMLAWVVKLAFLCKEKEVDIILATTLEARELFPDNPIFLEFEKHYLSEDRLQDKK